LIANGREKMAAERQKIRELEKEVRAIRRELKARIAKRTISYKTEITSRREEAERKIRQLRRKIEGHRAYLKRLRYPGKGKPRMRLSITSSTSIYSTARRNKCRNR